MIDSHTLEDARARRDELRRQRGIARLDDTPFDEAALDAAEREVSALSEALNEQGRRAAAARAHARREGVARSVATLKRLEGRRLKAVAEAEASSRSLVAALNAVAAAGEQMRAGLRESDLPVPLALSEGAMADRLSQRLAAVLGRLEGHPTRFAQVTWRPSWRAPGADWREEEKRELAADIEAVAARAEPLDGSQVGRSG